MRDSKWAKIMGMQEMMECVTGKSWVRKRREGAEEREWRSETGKRLQTKGDGGE